MNYKQLDRHFQELKSSIKINRFGDIELTNSNKYELYKESLFVRLGLIHEDSVYLRKSFNTLLLIKLKRNKRSPNWGKFMQRLNRIGTKRTRKHRVLFPVNIKFRKGIQFPFKSITIEGTKFKLHSLTGIKRLFNLSEFYSKYQRVPSFSANRNFYYLVATIFTSDVQEAFDETYVKFTNLRNAINTSLLFGSRATRLGKVKELSLVRDPFIFLVLNDKTRVQTEYEDIYDSPIELVSRTVNHQIDKGAKYKQILNIVKKKEKSYLEKLLLECIKQYSLAHDTKYRPESFMHFWRLLEIGTLTTNKIRSQKKMIKIIKSHFKHKGKKIIGDLLVKVRNTFVHSGKYYEFSDDYINWCKEYAEVVLNILFWLRDNGLQNKEQIQSFYEVYPWKKTPRMKDLHKITKKLK